MKVEPGKSYRTRGGNTGVITDWYDTKEYVLYAGYIRYRDPGMSNLFGLEWDPTGKCMNYPSGYDLTEEIAVSAAPPPNTPLSNEKPTNPKDMIATNKVPFHLWPETASAYGALAMAEGAMKYGRSNWRHSGAKASVYYDAARRHLNAWFEGEDFDASGAPHLAHVLACVAILVDSIEAGNLHDDRMYPGGYHGLTSRVESIIAQMRERHADKNPQHYTIAQTPTE